MRKFIKDPLFERLQEHAVAVWDHAPESIQVTAHDDLLRLARQSSARVRLQLALSAARYSPTLRHEVIAALMQGGMHDQIPQAKPWFVFAVRNALGDSEQMAAVYLKVRQQNADAGEAWLPEVVQTLTYDLSSSDAVVQKRAQSACEQIASLTQDAKARDAVFSAVAGAGSVAIASRLLDLFGLKQADVQAEMGQKLEAFLAESDREAMGHQSTLSPALRLAKTDSFLAAVKELLHPARPTVFQAAALDAVSWRDEPAAYGLVLAAWPQLVGATKARAWSMIVEKPRGLDALELALKQKQLAVSLLNAEEQRQLREHPRPEIRNRFAKLLVAPNREELSAIVARYEPVLAKVGADGAASADKKLVQTGKAVFQRVCAACHAVNGVGVDVGPPLGGNVAEKSDSQLLLSVLDPSREVDPKFLGYTALLTDGRVISGIIVDETPEMLTLSVSGGQRQPVPRGDLEQLKQTGKSLMPEGLEQQISPDEMAALFAFLRSKKD